MADKPRDLPKTIDAMLAIIPGCEHELIRRLTKVRDGSHYCPPEAMGREWRRALAALIDTLGAEPDPGWQTEVAEVFRG